MRKTFGFAVLLLAFSLVFFSACGTFKIEGEVTGKYYTPGGQETRIDYVGCGLTFDGQFDCFSLKPKLIIDYVPDSWVLVIDGQEVEVSHRVYNYYNIGDHYPRSKG